MSNLPNADIRTKDGGQPVPSNSKVPLTCWICGRTVSLETCVIDEHGIAVHEECSVVQLRRSPQAVSPVKALPVKIQPAK